MPVITILSTSFSREIEVAEKVSRELGYQFLSHELLEFASTKFNVPYKKLFSAIYGAPSMFNEFTHEKERNIAYIQAALAEKIQEDNLVYLGEAVLLLPNNINHLLKVCLTATQNFRISMAMENQEGRIRKEAKRLVVKDDQNLARWAGYLHNLNPLDKSLYDIKLPMHLKTVDEAVSVICDNAKKGVLLETTSSRQAVEDFVLASRVRVTLIENGHNVQVACQSGNITITVDKFIYRFEKLKKELSTLASEVSGVGDIEVKAGPNFHEPIIYRKQNFEVPSKVLLVDDEKEFVETLSERLQMRDFGTVIASNGEEALSMVKDDQPDVMVLDLRMPGIDGLEVLRELKKDHPEIEVIILTGHGSDEDRELAMKLGAFAFLEKPVDIDELSKTMKAAYEKLQKERDSKET